MYDPMNTPNGKTLLDEEVERAERKHRHEMAVMQRQLGGADIWDALVGNVPMPKLPDVPHRKKLELPE